MKTNLVKITKVLLLASMTLILANCSKDSGGGSSAAAVTNTNTGYVLSQGQCYSTTTGQISTGMCSGINICNGTYYFGYNGQTVTIQCSSTSTLRAVTSWTPAYQSGTAQVYNCSGASLYQLITTTGMQSAYTSYPQAGGQSYLPVTCQ